MYHFVRKKEVEVFSCESDIQCHEGSVLRRGNARFTFTILKLEICFCTHASSEYGK